MTSMCSCMLSSDSQKSLERAIGLFCFFIFKSIIDGIYIFLFFFHFITFINSLHSCTFCSFLYEKKLLLRNLQGFLSLFYFSKVCIGISYVSLFPVVLDSVDNEITNFSIFLCLLSFLLLVFNILAIYS